MQLFLKMLSGMANSVDPDQQSDLGLHCLHFIRNFGVLNFRTFTITKWCPIFILLCVCCFQRHPFKSLLFKFRTDKYDKELSEDLLTLKTPNTTIVVCFVFCQIL